MPSHDYTAREALDLLVNEITKVNKELASRIELAVNEGKETQILAPDQPTRGRRRRVARYYRKNEPFTDEEALQVALTVLKAHLIETRMFARAAHGEFYAIGMADPKSLQSTTDSTGPPANLQGVDTEKVIEIELEPETVQSKRQVPNHTVKAEQHPGIESLRAIFDELREVLDFG
ncbi:MAG: hypothetical protein WD049_03530 [Candidatus Paceibacterota bacterium]